MRKTAKLIGMTWIGLCIAAGVVLGIGQTFLGWHGLIFKEGYGDIWIFTMIALPGVFLYNWGKPKQPIA